MTFRQEKHGNLAVSEVWLDSLNEELPYVRIEQDNFQIKQTCSRARDLLKSLENLEGNADRILDTIKEMHKLDQIATTWRRGPEWAYKIIHRSEMGRDWSQVPEFPEYVQLHHDVPQSLGDIDHRGRLAESLSRTPKARGVGAYFLLWPIKMIKALKHPTTEQKRIAQVVFERIREYTGMKSTLGERSNI